jgi:RimJ/RimL family protein N-acetyltransferase/DNA-binding transcriptional ArsR family regulator
VSADRTYRAIADGTRREIIDMLARDGALPAGQIAQRIPALSRPAVSRHLRVLRQARLVAADQAADDGREQLYRLEPQALAPVQQWVERYRGFWEGKLDALAAMSEKAKGLSPKSGANAVWEQSAAESGATATTAPTNQAITPLSAFGLRPLALPMLPPRPVILAGRRVQLVPLTLQAVPFVQDAVRFRELWRLSTLPMDTPEDAARYVESALAEQAAGRALPFGLIALPGAAGLTRPAFAGSTRFGNIAVEHSRVEIGWTWLLPQFQRTGLNREAKLLLLTHAFETLGARRVEFKGDARNAQSRRALEGIGATFEGLLRRHLTLPDGTQRDSFYFSIIAEEWPEVKERLALSLSE